MPIPIYSQGKERSTESGSRYSITHNGQIYSYQGNARLLNGQWETRVTEITKVEDHDDGPLYWRTRRCVIADWIPVSDKFSAKRLRQNLRMEFTRRGWLTILQPATMPLVRGLSDDGADVVYEFALAPPRCPDVEMTVEWMELDEDTRNLWRRVQSRVSFTVTSDRFAAAVAAAGRCRESADVVAVHARRQYDGP